MLAWRVMSERTRLIVDLSGSGDRRAPSCSPTPIGSSIDLPQIAFGLPEEAGRQGRGLVSAFRFGLIAPGKSRIVLDLAGPATIDKAFVLEPVEGQPARLVIDLVKADRSGFLAAMAAQRKPAATRRRPARPPARRRGPAGGGDRPRPWRHRFGCRHVQGRRRRRRSCSALPRRSPTKIERDRALQGRADARRRQLRLAGRTGSTSRAPTMRPCSSRSMPTRCRTRSACAAPRSTRLSDKASDAESARYAEKENRADLIAGVDLRPSPTTSPTSSST